MEAEKTLTNDELIQQLLGLLKKNSMKSEANDVFEICSYVDSLEKKLNVMTEELFNVKQQLKDMQEDTILNNLKKEIQDASERLQVAGSRVMIIDNNSINRSIIKSYLAETGCIIDEIDNTTEAIGKLVSDKTGIYDAILIDSSISIMKSYDISTVIRSIPLMKHTPLILLVSVDYNKDIISKEYSGYITKPYRRSEILDCLTMVINENCNISDSDADFFTRNIKIEASRNQFETLVVDDNETNRLYFTYLLQMNGINCDIATNGEEALAACRSKNYDLIFMDVQMPIMDGYEATRKIRETEASNQHAVIIAMTAYAMKEDEEKCLASGMDDYLTKPINHERVVALLKNIRESINARSN